MTAAKLTEEAIFHVARRIHLPDLRGDYLRQACGPDEALRARVEELLRVHDEEKSFLAAPVGELLPTMDEPVGEGPGTVVGPYKLLEQIGEGGFGVVFMAEQHQPLRRKVALKVLKPGMDTRQVVARFEAERQALALMDHPNIARVFDGGETGSGRPYFVMELVKGVPITDYCDQAQLTPRQRLELFLPVCLAVQHAHQKGIIHRDLKPSNVLVTLQDGKPLVKVIDFGIAKALGQQLTDKTLFTGFAQLIGTPLYMAPEQAALSNVDVDTRSDIYSLGVLLYELLTGTTPFDKERFRAAGYDEIRRIIREEEPPGPSTRISTLGQAATTASTQRQSDPRRLSQLLRGELDWVVMKCLEKDRNRRYETANDLARDVERYLHDEPVQACPPSAWYRFRKLARRNRAALTTAAAVLATIIVGLAASTFLITQERDAARGAAQRESEERQRAETNLRSARKAVDRVFTLAAEKMAEEPHMEQIRRALLEDALEFYQGFLKQKGTDPLLRYETARAYLRVGSIQILLGRLDQTEGPLRQAVALLQRLADEYPSVLEYRSDLAAAHGSLCHLFAEHMLRRPQDCLENALAALAIKRKLVDDFPSRPEFRKTLAEQLSLVALHYHADNKNFRKGEEYFRESLRAWQAIQKESPDDPDVPAGLAHAHFRLGALYLDANRLREAEAELRRGLALREKLLAGRPGSFGLHAIHIEKLLAGRPGWYGLRAMQALNKAYLAALLMGTGRPAEAEPLLREAIAFRERMTHNYPSYYEHWRRLFYDQCLLERCLLTLGRPQEAEEMIRRRLAISQKVAAEFPNAADTSNRLGEAYHDLASFLADCSATQFRDPARATELADRALQFAPQSGPRWFTLGLAQYRAGQSKAAIESLQKSMAFQAGGNSRHWFILAMAHWQLGNKAEARKWYDQAVKWMEKNQPGHEQQRRLRAEAAGLLGIKDKKD